MKKNYLCIISILFLLSGCVINAPTEDDKTQSNISGTPQSNDSKESTSYYELIAESIFVYETGMFIKIVSFKNMYSFEKYEKLSYDYSHEIDYTQQLAGTIKTYMTNNNFELSFVLSDEDGAYYYFNVIRKKGDSYYACTFTEKKTNTQQYYSPAVVNLFVPEQASTYKTSCFKNVYSFEQYCGINYDYSKEENITLTLEPSVKAFMESNSYELLMVLLGQDTNQMVFELIRKNGENYYCCKYRHYK